MPKTSGLPPGQPAPKSGQYQQIGPRGGKGAEITFVKEETLPPAPAKGTTYTLVDPTDNSQAINPSTKRAARS